jgi:diaminopimelate epimerase
LLRLQTLSGIKTVSLVSAQAPNFEFTVNMGNPRFAPAAIPLVLPGIETFPQLVRYSLECNYPSYQSLPITALSMGNPHCSIFVEDLGHSDFTRLDWANLGKQLEWHPAFPQRTNVEFIQVLDSNTIAVRFWERGVGITNSSGTGASAAAVAAVLNGYTNRKLTVITLAGKLHLHWQDDDTVALTGPATIICRGEAFWEL